MKEETFSLPLVLLPRACVELPLPKFGLGSFEYVVDWAGELRDGPKFFGEKMLPSSFHTRTDIAQEKRTID
jgi:hypothetical protein